MAWSTPLAGAAGVVGGFIVGELAGAGAELAGCTSGQVKAAKTAGRIGGSLATAAAVNTMAGDAVGLGVTLGHHSVEIAATTVPTIVVT